MNQGSYIFAQISQFLRKNEFDKAVEKFNGDYRYKKLKSWNHLLQLVFGQITGCLSIRDIALCLNAHKKHLYHLGIKNRVNESTISRANENRDWRIFASFGAYMIELVKPYYSNQKLESIKFDNDIFIIDSTSISLSIKLCCWASGKRSKGGIKVHTVMSLRGNIPTFINITQGNCFDSNFLDVIPYDPEALYVMDRAYVDFEALNNIDNIGSYFIVRSKSNLLYKATKSNPVDKTTGLQCDQYIRLKGRKPSKSYAKRLRRIKYYDKELDKRLVFLTNNFELDALEITNIYRSRWQIEVFFKWIKQNLTIKHLWGNSVNAVHIHIWVAIITYLLVAYIKAQLRSELSISEIHQILGISTFSKTPINELLSKKQNDQNFKELPNLFTISDKLTHQ